MSRCLLEMYNVNYQCSTMEAFYINFTETYFWCCWAVNNKDNAQNMHEKKRFKDSSLSTTTSSSTTKSSFTFQKAHLEYKKERKASSTTRQTSFSRPLAVCLSLHSATYVTSHTSQVSCHGGLHRQHVRAAEKGQILLYIPVYFISNIKISLKYTDIYGN